MWNIIKADMFRIRKSKGIYVCIAFIIVFLSVSIYLKSPGHIGMSGSSYNSEEVVQNPDANMEEIRDMSDEVKELDVGIAGTGGNLYYFFLPVVFIVFCTDLSNHTTKNVIATEVSRSTYYFAKLALSLFIGFVFIVLYNYGGYVGSLLFNGSSSVSNLMDITIITIRQLPIYCGIISLLVMIACLCQKAALYNGISIALVMIIQLVIGLTSTIFKFDPKVLMSFEFEGIIRSLSVVGILPLKTLCIGVGTGVFLSLTTGMIGMYHFNRCNIK